jgi:hypothetical protein
MLTVIDMIDLNLKFISKKHANIISTTVYISRDNKLDLVALEKCEIHKYFIKVTKKLNHNLGV